MLSPKPRILGVYPDKEEWGVLHVHYETLPKGTPFEEREKHERSIVAAIEGLFTEATHA